MKSVAIIDLIGIKAGMNYYDLQLAEALIAENVEVFIFSNFNSNIDYRVYKLFKNKNYKKICTFFNLLKGFRMTITIIRSKKIGNIIFHIFSYNLLILWFLKRLKSMNLNIILIIHDVKCIEGENINIIRKKIINYTAHKIVVHNEFSKKELQNEIYNKDIDIFIIPHGNYFRQIDTKISKVQALKELNLDDTNKYLLFFGQIKKTKGLEILLDALIKVDDNIKLIIAGKPWKTTFVKYEENIRKNKLSGRVIKMIKYIDDREKDLLFNACDLGILPYKKIYQSGVLLMCMSYGLPIIVSDLEPNKEIIKNGENGFLFKAGNKNDLASKIEHILNNNELYQKISKNSIITAQKYSWDKIAKKYKELII